MADQFDKGFSQGSKDKLSQADEFNIRDNFIREHSAYFAELISKYAEKFRLKSWLIRLREGRVYTSIAGWNGVGPSIEVSLAMSPDLIQARIVALWPPSRREPEYGLLAEGAILRDRMTREQSADRNDVEFWLGRIFAAV